VAAIGSEEQIERIEIAGPGFINFFLGPDAYHAVIGEILEQAAGYGRSYRGAGQLVQVEFVSANPTGPLHVGHGRGAAYGAAVADLLEAVGYAVHREYYVNDAGRQMDILAASVYLRYLELCGEETPFPANGYQGDYVWDIGATLHREQGERLRRPAAEVFAGVPADEPAGGDRETHIDGVIARSQALLGREDYRLVFDAGLDAILHNIRQDLKEFGVVYDEWFSERSLTENGAVDRAISRLEQSGHTYRKAGALWFRSTDYGDEKDRVIVRENGQKTYFASDIAYHANKLERGYTRVIDIWGADHGGYIKRMQAAVKAVSAGKGVLDVKLVQLAKLLRAGEPVKMSKRAGDYVTLREVVGEVGRDAVRFDMLYRKNDAVLDFDLAKVIEHSRENPVFYVQYGHARAESVFRNARVDIPGLPETPEARAGFLAKASFDRLTDPGELAILRRLALYPRMVEAAAAAHEPHRIAFYLYELASEFHAHWTRGKDLPHLRFIIQDDRETTMARLALVEGIVIVLASGLALLGVEAPEEMR